MTRVSSVEELQRRFAEAVTDTAARARWAREVFPNAERLRLAFRPGSEAAIQAIAEVFDRIRLPDDAPEIAWATVIDVPADRTEVRAFRATQADSLGSAAEAATGWASAEARFLAQHWLAPERAFFEVHCCNPGSTAVTRFHLLFHDGHHWCMAGPLWRFLKNIAPPVGNEAAP